jgi:hypothetical protein
MTALLLVLGIAVQPLPSQEVKGAPVTPVEAARAWLDALGDLKEDRLSALTAYPFRWTLEWRRHEVPRKGRRRLPRPIAGHHESCPVFVRSAALMSPWLACMRMRETGFVGALVFANRSRGLGKGEVLSIALEGPARPETARLQRDKRTVWVLASLTDRWNEEITIRLAVGRDDHGELRVERMLARVDFVYDEERFLSEQRERERHFIVR